LEEIGEASKTMNSLEHYIENCLHDDETAVMNILQDHGIISDNCIHASEVIDSGKAVSWIERNPQFFHHGLVKKKTKP
jgi:hypothetical protein